MVDILLGYWSGQGIYSQVLRFFVVLGIGVFLTRGVAVPIASKIYSKKGDKALHSIENLTSVIGLFIAFTVALQAGKFGGLVSVLAAIGAAATVAVGFGMRDQVSNLTAGLLIHLDNPFMKGDYVKVGDTEGVVKEITMRATKLNGPNEKKQIVPNSMLTTGVIKNYTRDRKTKVSIETKIDLESAEEASELLLESISESKPTMDSPEPEGNYRKIEEGILEMDASFWVKKSAEVKKARSEVLKDYGTKMKEAGLLEKEEEDK